MKDLLTYADVSGRRRLRFYVKVSIFILAALIVLAVVAFWQQSQQQRAMAVTQPVEIAQTVAPVSTITKAPSATPEACPTDPEAWTMTEIAPGDVLLRIEPACVYEGLEKTIAFVLGITQGYSRQEVADALGFEKLPMVRLAQLTVANPNGPTTMDVVFAIDIPPYQEWTFREEGEPAVAMALQGCFRTYTIVGTEKQNWDENGYPVVCRISYDNESTAAAFCMGDACFSQAYPNNATVRGFSLLGYEGNGRWVWLGNEKIGTELDSQTMSNDREVSAQAQGVGPWDGAWLERAYELKMQPLPENWQSFSNETYKQKLKDALKAFSSGATSP